jgi:hypothetical protein
MKRLFILQAAVAAILVFGLVIVTGRLVQLAGPALAWDLSGRAPTTLPAPLANWLGSLKGNVDATLFVSDRSRMPSHLQDVEETTRALLEAMAAASDGRFTYRVMDPDRSGIAGARYAAARRVSPIRVRRVIDDAESQAEIWSSLVIAQPGRARRYDVLIQGIENAHLPYLGSLVAAHLRTDIPQASFALAAPAGFSEMPRFLSQHGPVVEVDVDRGAEIPADVDILFWLEPANVTPRHLASLRRFLASGRTVVLAGSPYRVEYSDAGDGDSADVRFQAQPKGDAWTRLLEPFGLQPLPDLVMDRNSSAALVMVDGRRRPVAAPFHLRNLPTFRDHRPFRTPARGGLSFVAPGPLQIDPQRVAAAGYEAHVAATTTERAWVRAMPETEFGLADLTTDLIAPKQNLMVLLTPQDPWAGRLLVLAASSPFRDGMISQSGFGHTVFLTDLARTFAHPQELIGRNVERYTPAALPALSDGGRIAWRLVIVALLPSFWLLAGMRRLGQDAGIRWQPPQILQGRRSWVGIAVPIAGFVIWLLLRGPLSGLRADATTARLHTPSPLVLAELQRISGDLDAELIQSAPSALPPDIRVAGERLVDLLHEGGVSVRTLRVDRSVSMEGVTSFEVERVRKDTSVTTRIVSALRLSGGGQSTVIPKIDEQTGRHLDFLVAAALGRLQTGHPVVSVISDLPRLSPAEALEDYQKKGLSAPQGVDVYSRAKGLLTDYGYKIRHVSTRDPSLPQHSDAILWFQPRRNSTPILTQVSDHLGKGGHAIVALQHFNIQQRQYRGTGFETVHWPQPQFQDLDRYLRLFGVEQAREVLLDRTQHHLEIDTQVNRSAVREYNAQRVALPFLIRAVHANFSAQSPITRNLGDLLFVWGNRFRFYPDAMKAADMRAEVLVTTTANAWAYEWSGGWLPAEVFDEAINPHLPGPQALALSLEGRFPPVQAIRTEDAGMQLVPQDAVARGQLLLIGSSEMFKDEHLLKPGFAHDQLLLNSVAHSVYGPELATLQSRQGAAVHGFAVVDSVSRTIWRIVVIGAGPLLLGLFAAGQQQYRRRQRQAGTGSVL